MRAASVQKSQKLCQYFKKGKRMAKVRVLA